MFVRDDRSHRLKVLFINDSTTNANWGDRAAAISLRAMVTASGGRITHSISEDDLALSSFGGHFAYLEDAPRNGLREVIKAVTPPIVLVARRKMFRRVDLTAANRVIPERWEEFDTAAKTVLEAKDGTWPTLVRAIRDVDVTVIHGDGAMVGNGIIPRTDLFLTYLAKRCLGKPVIMVNHSADFDHPDLHKMAEHVYPLFDDVVFRDPVSAKRCEALCDGRFAADTAFWFEPAPRESWVAVARRPTYFDVWPDTATFDPSEPYLCIGGSSLHSTAWRPLEIAKDYMALVQHLKSVYKGQIVLTLSGLQELEVFRPLARELGLPLIAPTIPVQQAVDILGNSDAYIGGRWHTAIFALRGGAPVVALSAKQGKMQALMQSAGLPATEFDAFAVGRESESIAGSLLEHIQGGQDLRHRLRTWADGMAANCWDNVAYLKDFPNDR
jgi:hypothetical protein